MPNRAETADASSNQAETADTSCKIQDDGSRTRSCIKKKEQNEQTDFVPTNNSLAAGFFARSGDGIPDQAMGFQIRR